MARLVANWWEVARTCNLAHGSPDPVSRWLIVTRACVQPITITATAIAGLLAATESDFRPGLFLLATLGLVLAHAASNLVNDLFDLSQGVDDADQPRALYAPHPVLSGLVRRHHLVRVALALGVLDATLMVALTAVRGWPVPLFALAGLFLGVAYVAPPFRLKVRGLGEPSVFLVWGPLMVSGTYYVSVGRLPAAVVAASVPYGLLVTTVLLGKHIDKIPWDLPRGVGTLPVLIGDLRARQLTLALMFVFHAAVALLVAVRVLPLWALATLLALPLLGRVAWVYVLPKPGAPPEGYPLWPLWFVSWAFLHARRAGALLVLGLALGALWPLTV